MKNILRIFSFMLFLTLNSVVSASIINPTTFNYGINMDDGTEGLLTFTVDGFTGSGSEIFDSTDTGGLINLEVDLYNESVTGVDDDLWGTEWSYVSFLDGILSGISYWTSNTSDTLGGLAQIIIDTEAFFDSESFTKPVQMTKVLDNSGAIDEVRGSLTRIPEPSVILLMFSGLIGLSLVNRRKKV